jgi:hypothetical protein
MPPDTCKVSGMEEWLLDLVHTKWRALVVVACLAWVIDGHFEGNTVFEGCWSPDGLHVGGRDLLSGPMGSQGHQTRERLVAAPHGLDREGMLKRCGDSAMSVALGSAIEPAAAPVSRVVIAIATDPQHRRRGRHWPGRSRRRGATRTLFIRSPACIAALSGAARRMVPPSPSFGREPSGTPPVTKAYGGSPARGT